MSGRAEVIGLILASALLNAAAQIFLRLGARSGFALEGRSLAEVVWDAALRPGLWLGLLCYGASVVTWIYVLSRAEASFAYPFLGLGFVIVAAAASLWLGEAMTPRRIAGTALIVLGVIVIAGS